MPTMKNRKQWMDHWFWMIWWINQWKTMEQRWRYKPTRMKECGWFQRWTPEPVSGRGWLQRSQGKKPAMEMRTLTKMEMGMPQMDDTDRMALEAQGWKRVNTTKNRDCRVNTDNQPSGSYAVSFWTKKGSNLHYFSAVIDGCLTPSSLPRDSG